MLKGEQFPTAAAALIAQRLLNRHSAHEIAEAVEVLVDLLDLLGGDPEAEAATWPENIHARPEPALPDDHEPEGDERDCAWVEWNTMRGSQKRGPNVLAGHEDDEEDDAPEEDDPAGQCDEDGINTGKPLADGPGCSCSDPTEESRQPVTLNIATAAND